MTIDEASHSEPEQCAPRLRATTIFAGPTIDAETVAATVPGATIAPPAARGDIWRAVEGGAQVIGLIDGYFEHVPAVWHKELLDALERGCTIFGSSSMGALRAAELSAFGMIGVGDIVGWIANGTLSDADVAVTHGPAPEYRSTCVAHANVAATLTAARSCGAMTSAEAELVSRVSRSMFYPERVYPVLVQRCVELGFEPERADEIRQWFRENAVDQKRADAVVLLGLVAEARQVDAAQAMPDFHLARTTHYERMIVEETSRGRGGAVSSRSHPVIQEIALDPQELALVTSTTEAARHSTEAARRQGARPTQQLLDESSERLRRRFELWTEADFDAWLDANDLDWDGYCELVERRCVAELPSARNASGDEQGLLDELRWSGRYASAAARSSRKESTLRDHGFDESGTSIVADPTDDLDWYSLHLNGGTTPVDLEDHAQHLGFTDATSLLRASRRERRFREILGES